MTTTTTTTALIADIHGNAWALNAVLSELEPLGIDQIVCLGDVAVLGPHPKQVVHRLREIEAITVLGNVDAWLNPSIDATIARPPQDPSSLAILAWTRDQLSPDELHWLTTLPLQETVDLGAGHSLLAFHGGPRSCDTTISAGMTEDEIAALLPPLDPGVSLVACGHTHVPMLRSCGFGALVNPGSVGLPGVGPGGPNLLRNQHVTWADYAIIRSTSGLRPDVLFRRVSLDVAAMIADARGRDMPEFDWWISHWAQDSRNTPSSCSDATPAEFENVANAVAITASKWAPIPSPGKP